MTVWDWILTILVLAGALNWGLVGLFNFDLVASIFGSYAAWIYAVVGISGVVSIVRLIINRKKL